MVHIVAVEVFNDGLMMTNNLIHHKQYKLFTPRLLFIYLFQGYKYIFFVIQNNLHISSVWIIAKNYVANKFTTKLTASIRDTLPKINLLSKTHHIFFTTPWCTGDRASEIKIRLKHKIIKDKRLACKNAWRKKHGREKMRRGWMFKWHISSRLPTLWYKKNV